MFSFKSISLFLLATLLVSGQTPAKHSPTQASPTAVLPAEPGLYATINTSMGSIVCRLFDKDAPKTVANFRGLASGTKLWTDPKTRRKSRRAFFNGLTFHRVIPDFMIQGGDPLGDGTGGPGYQFEDEFNSAHSFEKPGMLAMANSGPNTNGSQFFITVAPTPHLDGKHTIFGEVVSGQDVADAISKVPANEDNKPNTPVRMTSIVVKRVGPTPASETTSPARKAPVRKTAPKKQS